jgi:hypothetical protein
MPIKRTLVTPLNMPFSGTSNSSKNTNTKIVGSIKSPAASLMLGEAIPSREPKIMANSNKVVEWLNKLIIFDKYFLSFYIPYCCGY